MAGNRFDRDLEMYRNLIEVPREFREGFGWSTVVGIVFCGLVMMPGSIYLGLMTGGSLGAAATWVTVILFAEISRRALAGMNRQQLVVLLHAANVMIAANVLFPGGPFGHLVFRAYLVGSDAVRDAGMSASFPTWWAPPPDSPAILERNFLHPDWRVPILLVLALTVLGALSRYTLGYFFFRLTSDVENLPFPLAPISAQGAMAMAEVDEVEEAAKAAARSGAAAEPAAPAGSLAKLEPPKKKQSLKWRIFSLGATLGIAFGAVQVGIPAITGLFLEKPIYLVPQPFVDTTTFTEAFLPATPTGVTCDIGIILVGFVLPFWAVIGSFIAIALTVVLNPILHGTGFLTHWQPGMNTINTTFANRVDFWLSFSIGAGLGIAIVSIWSTIRDVRRKLREQRRVVAAGGEQRNLWAPPRAGRGDYPVWIALAIYGLSAVALVVLCKSLVPQFPVLFLVLFAFLYNPFISYVNARLLGIAGQQVDIPFVKESSFILSGAKGVDIWLAPIPIENYGYMAQAFRVNELTGVRFWSLIKTDLVAIPVLLLLSFAFWSFIWHSDPVPSDSFPYAQVQWELMSKDQALLFSSTFVPEGQDPASVDIRDSQFMKAIKPRVIASSLTFTVVLSAVLGYFGLPIMLIYGFIRGFGQLPHFMLLEIVGALWGRWYWQRRYGQMDFLRQAPTLLAGYFTGVGLISMATIAMRLIQQAVTGAPF